MLALLTTSAAPKTYSEPWTKTIMCLHRLVCLSQPHKAVVKSTSISTATSSLSTESYMPHSSVSICCQLNACTERTSLDNSIPNTLYNGEDNSTITVADSSSGIPIINTNPSSPIHLPEGSSTFYHEVTTRPISLDLAHPKLGHIGESRVRALASGQAEGLKLLPGSFQTRKCDHCDAGKIRTLPHPRTQPTLRKSNRPMEMLHLDLLQGPCAALGPGHRYLFAIVDDYTRMAWSIGLKEKDIREAWEKWYKMVKFQYKDVIKDFSILRLRADNGSEFIVQDMQTQ
jgi:hypothetical protein